MPVPAINAGAAAWTPFAVASVEDTFVDVSMGCSYHHPRKSQKPVCDDHFVIVAVVAVVPVLVLVLVPVAVVVPAVVAAIAFAYETKHCIPCCLAWD